MAFFSNSSPNMRWMHSTTPSTASQPTDGYYYNFNSSMPSYHHMQNGATASTDEANRSVGNGYQMAGYTTAAVTPPEYGFAALPPPPPPPQHHPGASLSMVNQQLPMYVGNYSMSPANSNRVMRNMAEKMRRDKLNSYIAELALLIPTVSNSSRRMDKTSVLRLTATFMRQHRVINVTRDQIPSLPSSLNNVDWPSLLLDEINGIMLIVTSVGKIVFITHNIEKVLGHTQIELFGQSLFNITAPEDHAELRKCLSPDENDENSSDKSGELEDARVSSSEVTTNASRCSRLSTSRPSTARNRSSGSSHYVNGSEPTLERQRRSFYLRLRHRCMARSEQPQYELVHLVGHLTIPKKLVSQAQRRSRRPNVEVVTTNTNEIFLVAVMKPFQERRVTELSLMEPCRDEYITRHMLDGTILYSDHRISVIAGYLPEEVCGLQGFSYMHKQDVHWAMVSLRQMFCNGENYGFSCYRLKRKNGGFIYLKTYGYLEFNSNTEMYSSFICVNSLLSDEEGERELILMKKRFMPLIECKVDQPQETSERSPFSPVTESNFEASETEEPLVLQKAIDAMMKGLPSLSSIFHEDPLKAEEPLFAKAKLMSKCLPPVDKQLEEIRMVTSVDDKKGDNSPQPQPSTSSATSPQSCTSVSSGAALSPPVPSRTLQNRPSVLRIAPSSRELVTIYNDSDNCVITSTTNSSCGGEIDMKPNLSSNQNTDCPQRRFGQTVDTKPNITDIIKQEVPEDENFERISTTPSSKERTADVVKSLENSTSPDHSPINNERTVVVVRRSPSKRQFDYKDSYSPVPIKKSLSSPPPNQQFHQLQTRLHDNNSASPFSYGQHLSYPLDIKNHVDIHLTSSIDDFGSLPSIDQSDQMTQLVDIDSLETRDEKEEVLQLLQAVDDDLTCSHIEIASTLRMQGAQINAIQNDLDGVPFTPKNFYLDDLTQLTQEHIKHSQCLKRLTQDHHKLQRYNSDTVNV